MSELFNDVYGTSLLNLATRKTKVELETHSITQQDLSAGQVFKFGVSLDEGTKPGDSLEIFYQSDSFTRDFVSNNAFEADGSDEMHGSNLLHANNYPDIEDVDNVVAFNGGNDVNPKNDFLNLWFSFIKTDKQYLLNENVSIVNYNNEVTPPTAATTDLISKTMFIPIWNTSILRHRSEYSDTIIRGTEHCPIDPDLQAGILIQEGQVITYDSDVTSRNMQYTDQPNPLLRDVSSGQDFDTEYRYVPEGTLLPQTVYTDTNTSGLVLTGDQSITSVNQVAEVELLPLATS